MSLRVRGIPSCDRCRAARKWLDAQGIAYQWLDLREAPPSESELNRWLGQLGPAVLANRRSTTWRGLPEADRPALESDAWPGLLAEHPTLIKRPLFERGDQVRVGFDDDVRAWLESG